MSSNRGRLNAAPRTRTEATLKKRDEVWRVVQVSIRLDGEDEPLVVSAAAI